MANGNAKTNQVVESGVPGINMPDYTATEGVGIPGVNMPQDNTTSDATQTTDGTTPTPTETTTPTSTTEMAQDIVDKTIETGKTLDEQNKQAQEDAKKAAEDDQARIEKQAQDTEDLLKEQDKKIADLEESKRKRLEAEQAQQVQSLQEEKKIASQQAELEKAKLEADAQYQKIQNENAIIKANADIEIEKQRAAWQYNKLGLAVSSGIINQSQQIATNGIAKIAEIKARMNYNEAILGVEKSKIGLEMQKIELDYNNLINQTINTYSDKFDDLDMNTEKRIQDLTKNLLLTSQEKENKISEVLNDYRKEKQSLERQHIDDMFKIQDRGFEYQKQLEASMQKEKEEGLVKLSDELLNGNIAGMSPSEISIKERQLGLAPGTIMQKTDGLIRSGIRGMFDNAIGSDYVIPNISVIKNDVLEQMKQGRTLGEAVDIVGSNYIKNTPEYKRQQAAKAAKLTGGSKGGGTSGDVGSLISLAQLYGEELSPSRAEEIVKGGQAAIDTYLSGVQKYEKPVAKKEPAKVSDLSSTFVTNFTEDYNNSNKATTAYNQLINDGFTKEEAINYLAAQKPSELEVIQTKSGGLKLMDKDYFGDDTILNIE